MARSSGIIPWKPELQEESLKPPIWAMETFFWTDNKLKERRAIQSLDADPGLKTDELRRLHENNTKTLVARYIKHLGYIPTERILYENIRKNRMSITIEEVRKWHHYYSARGAL